MANIVKLTTRKMMRQVVGSEFGVTPLLCCKVSKLAKEHDEVQSYNADEVLCVVLMSFPLDLPWLSLKRLL